MVRDFGKLLQDLWAKAPAAPADVEYVTQRREDLLALRRRINELTGLLDKLPIDHQGELPEGLCSTACDVVDLCRSYSTAPDHFNSPVARQVAEYRKVFARKE